METAGVIVQEPGVLPVGHVVLGDKALVPAKDGSAVPTYAKRVAQADIPGIRLDDLRILSTRAKTTEFCLGSGQHG